MRERSRDSKMLAVVGREGGREGLRSVSVVCGQRAALLVVCLLLHTRLDVAVHELVGGMEVAEAGGDRVRNKPRLALHKEKGRGGEKG